jgi:predicted dehydrogenase
LVAFICNPTSCHVQTALACVRGGCDLFIEKPLSHDLEGISELLSEVRRGNRIVMVGYQLRFHPCFLALKRLLDESAVGAVFAARAIVGEYLPGWHPYEDYRRMYAARADLGGGVILTQIHEFDYLYALFGVPRRAFSLGGHLSGLEIDVEDVASTLMEFSVDARTVPVHLHQDYLQRPVHRSCEVFGDHGRIVMDLPSLSVALFDTDGTVRKHQRWDGWNRNEAFMSELRHFLDCVRTRRKPVVDLNDAIASLRMALAAKQSLLTGQVVAVQPVEAGA